MDKEPKAPQVFRPNQPSAGDEPPNQGPGSVPPITDALPTDEPVPSAPTTPSIEPETPGVEIPSVEVETTPEQDTAVPPAPTTSPAAPSGQPVDTLELTEVEPSTTVTQPQPVPPTDAVPTPPGTPPPASGHIPPSGGHHKRPWRLVAILIAIVVLIGAGTTAAYYLFLRKDEPATPHLKVGVMVAFTGGSSSMGYGEIKGVQLAKKQLGANNIEIIQEDSKCDPELAAQAVKRLVDKGVVAIIGDGCSSVSTRALPEANRAKVPMVSPSASSPALSVPDDYFFRVIPPDDFQGAFMAQTIYDKGIRTVGIFYTDESYGHGISQIFTSTFESLGGKVVASTSAEPDVIELEPQINEIKNANPEAIYFAPNSTLSATAAIKLAGEAGIDVPYFGADVLYDKTVVSNVGQFADGIVMTSFATGSKAFKQALYNEYQSTDLLYGAAQAYDAFNAIYLAIQKGATTGEQIKNTLPSIQFQGVSTYIKFDENGEISDPDYKYDLLTVKDGEIVTVE